MEEIRAVLKKIADEIFLLEITPPAPDAAVHPNQDVDPAAAPDIATPPVDAIVLPPARAAVATDPSAPAVQNILHRAPAAETDHAPAVQSDHTLTADSDPAPVMEEETPDPGGSAQVPDVALDPYLPVEDGPALVTQVHDRGPALAAPGRGSGPSLTAQVSGHDPNFPDLAALMSGHNLTAEDILTAQVSGCGPALDPQVPGPGPATEDPGLDENFTTKKEDKPPDDLENFAEHKTPPFEAEEDQLLLLSIANNDPVSTIEQSTAVFAAQIVYWVVETDKKLLVAACTWFIPAIQIGFLQYSRFSSAEAKKNVNSSINEYLMSRTFPAGVRGCGDVTNVDSGAVCDTPAQDNTKVDPESETNLLTVTQLIKFHEDCLKEEDGKYSSETKKDYVKLLDPNKKFHVNVCSVKDIRSISCNVIGTKDLQFLEAGDKWKKRKLSREGTDTSHGADLAKEAKKILLESMM